MSIIVHGVGMLPAPFAVRSAFRRAPCKEQEKGDIGDLHIATCGTVCCSGGVYVGILRFAR